MNENFKKFKKKVWIDVLIKCLTVALLAAFVAVNATLIPCKLFGIRLLWLLYLLIGLGGFALGGGIAFLIFRTDDKKIAKRMDAELNLSERVQTAYIYGNRNGEIFNLQREDAAETLKPIPARALPFKNLAVTVLCGVLALVAIVAVPVSAFTIPPVFANVDDGGHNQQEPPRQVTDWEWAALDDLIKYVQNSKIADEESKSAMVTDLNGLRDLLLNGVSQSSLSAFVDNTANQILNDVRAINENYPPQTDGSIHPQAAANNQEAAYVSTRLHEIFNLLPPADGTIEPDDPNGDDESGDKPDDGENNNEHGGLSGSKMPFFDPELGYVACGDVRSDYEKEAKKAYEDGLISREEWEYIIVTYFSDLNIEE